MSIRLVTFDLDNTLWSTDAVIGHAEKTMREWLASRSAGFLEVYQSAQMTTIRQSVVNADPSLRHDLSKLRREVLFRALQAAGEPTALAQQLADDGFEVFFDARHDVIYFDHVHAVLEVLSQQFTLAALTNGNADFEKLGLNSYFSFGYNSADVDAKKPHPAMFHAALAEGGVSADEAVHVGDSYSDDVTGARAAGLHAVWIPYGDTEHPEAQDPNVTTIRSLKELPDTIAQLNRARARE